MEYFQSNQSTLNINVTNKETFGTFVVAVINSFSDPASWVDITSFSCSTFSQRFGWPDSEEIDDDLIF